MKRHFFAIPFVALAATLFAANSDDSAVKTLRFNSQVNGIVLTASADVDLVYDTSRAGTIVYTASNNRSSADAPIKMTTEGTTLTIANVRRWPGRSDDVDVTVYYGTPIALLQVSSSGEIDADNLRAASNLSIKVTGSGDVDINQINCKSVDISVKSSGEVEVKTLKAGSANVSVAGSGDVAVGTLAVTTAAVSLNGSGDVVVNSMTGNTANVSLSGSGDVKIKQLKVANLSLTAAGSGEMTVKGTTSSVNVAARGGVNVSAQSLSSTTATVTNESQSARVHLAAAKSAMTISAKGTVTVKGKRPKKLSISGDSNLVSFKQ